MDERRLAVTVLLYGVVGAGVSVVLVLSLGPAILGWEQGAIALVTLLASVIVLPMLHARAGTVVASIADVGGAESGDTADFTERDAPVSAAEFQRYLPHRNRFGLSVSLLGVIVFGVAALASLL